MKKRHFINEYIKADKVQLIGENGEQIGVVPINEAIDEAKEKGLDLVLVSPNADPKVCKIMDYGKFMFEQAKREKEAKKQSRQSEIKEIRLSSNIAEHDMNHKAKLTKNFIEAGHKVKVTIRFRGREIAKKEIGIKVMEDFAGMLEEVAEIEQKPFMEGRSIQMILNKKK